LTATISKQHPKDVFQKPAKWAFSYLNARMENGRLFPWTSGMQGGRAQRLPKELKKEEPPVCF
jgi:hypothetical protein